MHCTHEDNYRGGFFTESPSDLIYYERKKIKDLKKKKKGKHRFLHAFRFKIKKNLGHILHFVVSFEGKLFVKGYFVVSFEGKLFVKRFFTSP